MEASAFGWFSVLPPALAIGMAIASRQVTMSLVAGIWVGWVIHAGWNPLAGTGEAVPGVRHGRGSREYKRHERGGWILQRSPASEHGLFLGNPKPR